MLLAGTGRFSRAGAVGVGVSKGGMGHQGPAYPGGQASGEGRGLIYRQMGRKGLKSIENVGPRLAEVVENLLAQQLDNPHNSLPISSSKRLPEFAFKCHILPH